MIRDGLCIDVGEGNIAPLVFAFFLSLKTGSSFKGAALSASIEASVIVTDSVKGSDEDRKSVV